MNPTKDHSLCVACTAFQNSSIPQVPSTIKEPVDVVFLFDQPINNPQVYNLIDSVVKQYPTITYGITYVTRCAIEKPKKKQVDSCLMFWNADLEIAKPSIIVPLGLTATQAILNKKVTMGSAKGQLFTLTETTSVLPLTHPKAVLFDVSQGKHHTLQEWLDGFKRGIATIADDESMQSKDAHYIYELVDTPEKLLAMKARLADASVIAFDTETSSVHHFNTDFRVVMMSLATDTHAYVLPLTAFWWDETKARLQRLYDDLFINQVNEFVHEFVVSATPKIGHNIKFDLLALLVHTGKLVNKVISDTFLLPYVLDSRMAGMKSWSERGLKRLAGVYLNMDGYDDDLDSYRTIHEYADPDRGGSYANIPIEVLWPYAAKDASASYLLWQQMSNQLSDTDRIILEQIVVPLNTVTALLQANGTYIDPDYVQSMYDAYTHEIEKLHGELYHDELATNVVTLYNMYRKANQKPELKWSLKSTEIMPLVFEAHGVPLTERTKTGKVSISRASLSPHESHPFVGKYLQWKIVAHALDSKVKPMQTKWLYDDGYAHPSYHVDGTVTGRLSSSNPNAQNLTRNNRYPGTVLERVPLKSAFTSRFKGGSIVQLDYSAMEVRIGASVAHVPGLIDAFYANADVHKLAASMIYGVPVDQVTKIQRQNAKYCNFGLWYLGNAWTLTGKYGLDIEEAQEVVRLYFAQFPQILDYHMLSVYEAWNTGAITSKFGRKRLVEELRLLDPNGLFLERYLHEKPRLKYMSPDHQRYKKWLRVCREVVNMPIQSAASDCLAMSLIVLNAEWNPSWQSKLFSTVHDSIAIDLYPGEEMEVARFAQDVMQNIPTYAQTHMPDIDFSWLRVPLVADVQMGTSLGDLDFTYVTDGVDILYYNAGKVDGLHQLYIIKPMGSGFDLLLFPVSDIQLNAFKVNPIAWYMTESKNSASFCIWDTSYNVSSLISRIKE